MLRATLPYSRDARGKSGIDKHFEICLNCATGFPSGKNSRIRSRRIA
jgi:hypothetical protein